MPLHLRLRLPVLFLGLGVAFAYIQPIGLALAALFIAWVLLGEDYLPRWLWWAVSLLASIALAAHLLPGFTPTALTAPRPISTDASPYAVRLSWDKGLVGLTLLAWWLGQAPRAMLSMRLALLVAVATLLLVPALALGLGLVSWQPKWPQELWVWLAVNLGIAVLAEELVFRAWLQRALIARCGVWIGVLLTALLFAAAHLPFSPLFALVAGVAGLGYGLAFHYSGRLSVAIALHATVNLCHLLLLSYPLRVN